MTLLECIGSCANNKEFVANWSRLRNVKLPTCPAEQAIDEATGYDKVIAKLFMKDVIDIVWSRIQKEEG